MKYIYSSKNKIKHNIRRTTAMKQYHSNGSSGAPAAPGPGAAGCAGWGTAAAVAAATVVFFSSLEFALCYALFYVRLNMFLY